MEVAVSRSGRRPAARYQAVADNLPNDPRIHAARKGSKKSSSRTFCREGVDSIVAPLAAKLMLPAQAHMVRPRRTAPTLCCTLNFIPLVLASARGGEAGGHSRSAGCHFPRSRGSQGGPGGTTRRRMAGRTRRRPRTALRLLRRRGRLGSACCASARRRAHAVSETMQFSYLVERKRLPGRRFVALCGEPRPQCPTPWRRNSRKSCSRLRRRAMRPAPGSGGRTLPGAAARNCERARGGRGPPRGHRSGFRGPRHAALIPAERINNQDDETHLLGDGL